MYQQHLSMATSTLLVLLCVSGTFWRVPATVAVQPSEMYQSVGSKVAPSDDAIDAQVADLEFTRPWFTAASSKRSTTPSPNEPNCTMPTAVTMDDDLTFGLGYGSVRATTQTGECWIRALHQNVGNVDVAYMDKAGATLVQAPGVSQLLLASIVALRSQFPNTETVYVTPNTAPYYAVLKTVVASSPFLHGSVEWAEPSDVEKGFYRGKPLIIVAITPNNPLGTMEPGLLSNCQPSNRFRQPAPLQCFDSPAFVISDHSYLWPCLIPHSSTPNASLGEWAWEWPLRPQFSSMLLFGLSKLSGHAGIRHGWAWIMDPTIASKVKRALWELGTALSSTSVLQASRVIRAIVTQKTPNTFHDWCSSVVTARWSKLLSVIALSPTVASKVLATNTTSTCYQVLSSPGSITALIQCPVSKAAPLVRQSGLDCSKQLEHVKILSTSGVSFGAELSTARISLGVDDAQFKRLILQLEQLPASC
jgi:aspartate/methionine/tyrosine aminotransferase